MQEIISFDSTMGGSQSHEQKETVAPVSNNVMTRIEQPVSIESLEIIVLLSIICIFKGMEWLYYLSKFCSRYLQRRYGEPHQAHRMAQRPPRDEEMG